MTPKTQRTLIRIGAGVAFFAILLWLMKALESVTTVILVAFFIAYILNPAVERLSAWGLGRSLSAFIILIIGLMIFVGLLMALIPAVVDEISAFATVAPGYVIALRDLGFSAAEKLNIPIPQDWNQVATILAEKGKQWLPKISGIATGVLTSVFKSTLQILSVILHLVLIPIVAYYFMVSFPNIKSGIAELIPPYTRDTVLGKLGEIDRVIAGFVRGQLTIALIMACLYTVGFVLIGIDLALVLGIISGLLFFIPYLGTLVALVGGTAMALAKFGDLAHMFYVLGWIAMVQTAEGYVLTPRIVGHAIGLPPVVYILAVIAGAQLFGFVGMLVAIPVTAVLLVLLKSAAEVYRNSYLYSDTNGAGLMAKGVLYVVSTPIGNLEDITARAVKILKAVNVIACEDTRQSRILMQRWNISTKLMSLHRFSETRKTQAILERLDRGEDVAIVTDAGTPAISDPGHRIVRAALDAGFQVTPIPGPSSITAALSASGMDCSSFAYLGFIPRKKEQRRSFFERVLRSEIACIFFETPHRILESLRIAAEILGSRRMVLMRELTKIHEEILSGTAADLLQTLSARDAIKGEIVIVAEGQASAPVKIDLDDVVKILMNEGLSGKRLADEAHRRFGVKKSAAYERFLALKKP